MEFFACEIWSPVNLKYWPTTKISLQMQKYVQFVQYRTKKPLSPMPPPPVRAGLMRVTMDIVNQAELAGHVCLCWGNEELQRMWVWLIH